MWRFDLKPYWITVLLYGLTAFVTIFIQGSLMYFPKIDQLLKTPFKAEKKGKILRFLAHISVNFGKSDAIAFSFLVRKRQILMRSDIKLPQPFVSWSNSR